MTSYPRAARLVPLVGQLRSSSARELGRDALAGLAVAASSVPQAMAYGEVAGVSAAAGLYTAMGAAVAFALCSSTRILAAGPSATLAMVSFTVIQEHAAGDPHRAVALAAGLALLTGGLCLVGAMVRWEAIADFLSDPVLLGYLTGSAGAVLASQVKHLAGQVIGQDVGPLRWLWQVLTHLPQVHWLSTALGLGCLAALVAGQRYLSGVPVPLVVLAGATALSWLVHLERNGVVLVGGVVGTPPAYLAALTPHDLLVLLPVAAGAALLTFSETAIAARTIAEPAQRARVELTRESMALGAANLGAGALGGFPVVVTASRSAGAWASGARTQLFQLVAAAIIGGVLLTGGTVVAHLPVVALAAVAMAGAAKLINVAGYRRLWRGWRAEGVIALAAAVGVMVLGPLQGLAIAVVLALGQLIQRAARPQDAVLTVKDLDQSPREREEGDRARAPVLIYRVYASLFFANAGWVRERILARLAERKPFPRAVIVDTGAIFYLDATATAMLARLVTELHTRGCQLVLARARARVLATLRADGVADLPVFASVRDAVSAAQQQAEQES